VKNIFKLESYAKDVTRSHDASADVLIRHPLYFFAYRRRLSKQKGAQKTQ